MKVNYILADTTKKATSMALRAAVSEAESDVLKNIIIIVPETKSIIIEKELLSFSENGAVANIFIYSFVRLLSRMGNIDSNKILSREACIVLIRKILFENLDKLNCYKKSAKSLGFAEKIYDTIAQFKSSNISPEDLSLTLPNFSETLRLKLTDILLIYSEYNRELSGKLFDDCDRLNLLIDFAKNSELLKSASVYVVGFDSITYEMENVLKEVAKYSEQTTFSAVYFAENRKDSYIQDNELYKKFKHIGDDLKQPYIPTFYKSFESGDFYSIANFLFSTEKKSVQSKGNIKIFEAKTKKDEIEYVANMIMTEIKAGKRYKDIGVLALGLEENKPLIEECFKRFDIPYFINISHDISSHFFVKFVACAYNLYLRHLSFNDVLAFVANPLFDSENKSAFFNFVKASGTNYSDFLTSPKYNFDSEADKAIVLKILEKLRDFYLKFEDKIKNSKTVCDFIKLNDFIFEYFDIKNKLLELAEKQKCFGEEIEGGISEAIFEKNERFSETLLSFMKENVVEPYEFLQIYLSGFMSLKVNLSPVSIDSVVVQDNTDGFFNIKDLFVFDAVDGKFPTVLEDKGIILDAEIDETISFVKKRLEPSVSSINARERFKAYEALLEPTERLYISYSLKGLGGTSSKPARIVLRLLNLFGEEILTREYKPAGFVSIKNSEMDFATHIGEYFGTNQGKTELNEEYSKIELSQRFNEWLENLNFSKSNFEIENAKDIYFYNGRTSISQLEKYFACPYRFFGTYGLKIKENKDAKLSKLDIGTIIHRVVELFAKKIDKFKNLSETEFEKEISNLLKISLEEMQVRSTLGWFTYMPNIKLSAKLQGTTPQARPGDYPG